MQCWIWPPYKDKGYTEFLENGCDALQCPALSIFFLGEPKGTNFGWVCSKTYGAHGVCNGLFSSWVLLLSTSHHLQFTFPCSHCQCYSSRWIVLIAVCSYQVLYLSWHLHVMWLKWRTINLIGGIWLFFQDEIRDVMEKDPSFSQMKVCLFLVKISQLESVFVYCVRFYLCVI